MGAVVSNYWCAGEKILLTTRHGGFAKPGDTSWTKALIGVASTEHALTNEDEVDEAPTRLARPEDTPWMKACIGVASTGHA